MKVGFVAIHYPHISHREEFIARVQRSLSRVSSEPSR